MAWREYRIEPGKRVRLADFATDDDGGMEEDKARREFDELTGELIELQELMYAQRKHALLVVLQAMDTGGKDSTIQSVFGPVDAQGCYVTNFKAPVGAELEHDFLRRVHQHVPPRGYIALFNRSHYEDVVAARVRGLVPETKWRGRYEHINSFERLLSDEGTTILKFYLHISKAYQKKRLLKRLQKPDKQWKFDPGDVTERARWDDYMRAYEDALSSCSTERAPWFVIPAEHRWYRNLLVAKAVVKTLRRLDMKYPPLSYDPATIVIPD